MMRFVTLLLALVATGGAYSAQAPVNPSEDFDALEMYDYGEDRAPLVRLAAHVRIALDDSAGRLELEERFVEIIDSEAAPGAKDFAFRQLRLLISEASADTLGEWLALDERHHPTRRILEGVPASWSGDVLAQALGRSRKTSHTVGLIGSLVARDDRQHVGVVLPLVGSDNPDVAKAAIDALGSLATPAEFPEAAGQYEQRLANALFRAALRTTVIGPNFDIVEMVDALEYRLQTYHGASPEQAATLTTLFRVSPLSAIDTILLWLDSDHRIQRQAATGLLQQLDAADPLLGTFVARLANNPGKHSDLLLDMAVKHGVGSTHRILSQATDETLEMADRVAAIRALGRSTLTPDAVDVLIDYSANQRDMRRSASRQSLVTARGAVTNRICERLTDPSWEIRAEAARALGERGATDRVDDIVTALSDANGRVRIAAWDAVAQVADGEAYPTLCRILFETRTSRERTIAARAVAAVARRFDAAPTTPTSQPDVLIGPTVHAFRSPLGEWQPVANVALREADARRLDSRAGTGALTNGETGRTSHLISEVEHGDVQAHIEFLVPKGSNSGVYFMGRYEVQVLDSYGRDPVAHSDCGGLYQRWKNGKGYEGHPPLTNASKPAGEWQSFDVIFRAPEFDEAGKKIANAKFIEIRHNSTIIHRDVELTGPTRASLWDDEGTTGPLMLQGDHGPVAYRNVVLNHLPSRADMRAQPILDQLAACDDDARTALRPTAFGVLASIGGDRAFAVLAGIANDTAATTARYGGGLDAQRAAVRALADWPGDQALEVLLSSIAAQPDSKLATVALRGALRQLKSSRRTDAEKLEKYREIARLATRPDAMRTLLSGLGELSQAEALDLVERYMNSADARSEAALAALNICEEIVSTHSDVVTQWLPRIERVLGDTVTKRTSVIKVGLELLIPIIPRWRLSGPYQRANTDGAGLLDAKFSPEDPAAVSTWQTVRAKGGEVNLSSLLGGSYRCAYLDAVLHATESARVRIEIGSDDGVVAWLNGKEIHRNPASRAYSLGEDRVMVNLEKGANRLLLKITQSGGGWAAGARVLGMDGSPVPGLRFDVAR